MTIFSPDAVRRSRGSARRSALLLLALLSVALASPVAAVPPSLQTGNVIEAAERLRPGEYLWAPEVAPRGPVLMVVSLATQRAVIYRNGVPIGITTVSTGRPGYRTPTGVFTILQKQVEHYSSLYDDAPMPYMQRLTWGGVALHGGRLPGYPASHGCIRLPQEFAPLLYRVTRVGMTVVITDQPAVPRVAPADVLLGGGARLRPSSPEETMWDPARSPVGPVSIVVSVADRRVVVLRNGVAIGNSPVEIVGTVSRTSAFVLSEASGSTRSWLRIALPGQSSGDPDEPLRGRVAVPEAFRREIEGIIEPGTTVVVTSDSLGLGNAERNVTVLEDGPARP